MKNIISVLLLLSVFLCAGCAGNTQGGGDTSGSDTTAPVTDNPVTDIPEEKFEMREDQVYAADLIAESDSLTIAFMGGSLTNGDITYHKLMPNWPICGNAWVNDIISYFVTDGKGGKQVKKVSAINAGQPGTNSDYAAARFIDQVASAEPDILFLEYTANDSGWREDVASLYYEYIIRQCLTLDKIPVIMIVHAVIPTEEGLAAYDSYMRSIAAKDAIAEHYGIKTINAYDYLKNEYAANDMGLSFYDWMGVKGTGYYNEVYPGYYDVHPNSSGYMVTARAVREALESDYEGCMSRPKFRDVYNKDNKDIAESDMVLVPHSDERIVYEGEWTEYNSENLFVSSDPHIAVGDHHMKYPYFEDGITQVVNPVGASFTFKTSAASVAVAYMSSTYNSDLTFYLVNEDGSNGKELGKISTYFDSSGMGMGMSRITHFLNVADDGEEHTVRVVVEDTNETHNIFRFGYIAECIYK
ncbi:MAG: SGNH/GDSL hydrolase family protein [Clostridia bacterium]|nr:SGNH/GDSL hydrolase family protein [Clostridia bacterium]